MRPLNFSKQLFFASLTLLSLSCSATDNTDKNIQTLYQSLQPYTILDMPARLDKISIQFMGKPYLLGALGEGPNGEYDQFPLYRTDVFDCETYVDTVLAIALASNPDQFKKYINQIRYHNGHVSFVERNHFTCLDWNVNNQHQGFVKDITTTLHNQKNQPVAKYARAQIDKAAWYKQISPARVRINNASPEENLKKLQALRSEGSKLNSAVSIIPYIPFSALFDKTGKANQYLFKQIPNGAIIEIVRPNWDLSKEIGTHLNVSHLGFVFWRKGTLFFRHSSSGSNKISEVPLIDYLVHASKSPTIKGINIQVIPDKGNKT